MHWHVISVFVYNMHITKFSCVCLYVLLCYSCLLECTCMLLVFYWYVLVCYSYVTRTYSYVTRTYSYVTHVLLLCTQGRSQKKIMTEVLSIVKFSS